MDINKLVDDFEKIKDQIMDIKIQAVIHVNDREARTRWNVADLRTQAFNLWKSVTDTDILKELENNTLVKNKLDNLSAFFLDNAIDPVVGDELVFSLPGVGSLTEDSASGIIIETIRTPMVVNQISIHSPVYLISTEVPIKSFGYAMLSWKKVDVRKIEGKDVLSFVVDQYLRSGYKP